MTLFRIIFLFVAFTISFVGYSQCQNFNAAISTQDTICVAGPAYSYQFNPTVTGGTAPYTYQWVIPQTNSGSLSSTNIINPTVTTWSSQIDVLLTVTDANGCIQNDTIIIDTTCGTIPPCNLNVQINPSDTICVGGDSTAYSYQLYPTITGGTTPYSYQWVLPQSAGGSLSATTMFAPIVTTWSSHLDVLFTVTDANGCIQNDTVVIDTNCQTVIPCNMVVSLATSDTICITGNSYQLYGVPFGGSAPYTYQWSLPQGNLGTLSSTSFFAPTVTTFTSHLDVLLTVTDANGCVKSDSVVIDTTCGPPPCNLVAQVDSLGSDTICVTGPLYSHQFNPVVTGGATPYAYQWWIVQNNAGSLSSNSIMNPTVTTWSSQIDILFTVTDANGCIQGDTVVIDTTCVPMPPPCNLDVQIDSQDTICVLGPFYSYQFNPTITGGTMPYSYQWVLPQNNSGVLSSTNTINPFVNAWIGHLDVLFTVTDANGCIQNDTIVIDTTCQNGNPPCNLSVEIDSLDIICVTGPSYSYQFNPTITEGTAPYTYQWVLPQVNSGAISSSTILNPVINTWTSQMDVLLVVADADGCIQIDSVVIDTTCQNSPLGINDIEENEFSYRIYPSPVNDQVNISSQHLMNNETITLYNFAGQKIMEIQSIKKEERIDVSNLANGIYFIQFDKARQTAKIVISH